MTDHDTVEGCARTAAACAAAGIEFIAGTELTAEHDGNELHILGLFPGHRTIRKLLDRDRQVSRRPPGAHPRNGRAAQPAGRSAQGRDRLRAGQLPLARPPARRPRPGARPASASTLDEAFERFLKKNRPAWVPKAKMSALEASN